MPSMLMPHNTGRKQRLQHMVHEMGHPPKVWGARVTLSSVLKVIRLGDCPTTYSVGRTNTMPTLFLACESLAVREDGVFAS